MVPYTHKENTALKVIKMVGYWDYTVILTYMSVASSLVGICLATQEIFIGAMGCLLLSGLCDMFDGMVARTKKNRTEPEKKFGIQLDSLADVICFGAFPAMMGYTLCKETVLWLPSVIVGVIYVLAAIIRLAYFNVTEEIRQQETKEKRKNYEGLPVTTIALILPTLFCTKGLLKEGFGLAYIIVLFLVALAFVIKFKVKKFGKTGSIVMVIIGILLFAILLTLQIAGL